MGGLSKTALCVMSENASASGRLAANAKPAALFRLATDAGTLPVALIVQLLWIA
jgi:hypothetical protein